MIHDLLSIPSFVRRRLAQALEAGMVFPPYTEAAIRSTLASGEHADAVLELLSAFEALGVGGPAAAAWIRSIEATASRIRAPDLVWTGPEVPGLHARDTRRVYEELFGSAERSIWASSYAYFDGPKSFKALAHRMDQCPELRVTLLLNIQRRRGDNTTADNVVRRFADRFWGSDWPGSSKPCIYYDPRSLDVDGPGGVLHAKVVIADEAAVFVTSANFTEAAWDRNIEVGLLARDRTLALSMVSHFRTLIDRQLLKPLPMA